jgi:hypothetical protein
MGRPHHWRQQWSRLEVFQERSPGVNDHENFSLMRYGLGTGNNDPTSVYGASTHTTEVQVLDQPVNYPDAFSVTLHAHGYSDRMDTWDNYCL